MRSTNKHNVNYNQHRIHSVDKHIWSQPNIHLHNYSWTITFIIFFKSLKNALWVLHNFLHIYQSYFSLKKPMPYILRSGQYLIEIMVSNELYWCRLNIQKICIAWKNFNNEIINTIKYWIRYTFLKFTADTYMCIFCFVFTLSTNPLYISVY